MPLEERPSQANDKCAASLLRKRQASWHEPFNAEATGGLDDEACTSARPAYGAAKSDASNGRREIAASTKAMLDARAAGAADSSGGDIAATSKDIGDRPADFRKRHDALRWHGAYSSWRATGAARKLQRAGIGVTIGRERIRHVASN